MIATSVQALLLESSSVANIPGPAHDQGAALVLPFLGSRVHRPQHPPMPLGSIHKRV